MITEDDPVRFLCLLDKLETSRELLKSGFGHLQEIDMGSTFYHLPHQLLASGFERLMKCYIAVVRKGRDGAYPDRAAMKSLGHDLESLLGTICTKHYGGTQRALVQQDLAFIRTDPLLNDCVRILSLFGKMGRYYNLDVVAGAGHGPMDPRSEWEALESRVEDPIPYLGNLERLHRDYYPRVNSGLIARMERLVRAIAMQFTLGGQADPGGELRRLSVVYQEFRNLRDDQSWTPRPSRMNVQGCQNHSQGECSPGALRRRWTPMIGRRCSEVRCSCTDTRGGLSNDRRGNGLAQQGRGTSS